MKSRLRKKWQNLPCTHQKSVSCGEGYYEYYCKLHGCDCMFSDCKHFYVSKWNRHSAYVCEKDGKRHPNIFMLDFIFYNRNYWKKGNLIKR